MAGAQIGPNAITQVLGPLEKHGGSDCVHRLLKAARIDALPDMSGLIDEAEAVRLHEALRRELPEAAPAIARAAGVGTGAYVLANRIPKPARLVLPLLPARLSARLLAKAIAQHAWTFAGSGRFRVAALRPLTFEIEGNPLAAQTPDPMAECHWHQAVFETLFRALVSPSTVVREVSCCGRGDPCCSFEVII